MDGFTRQTVLLITDRTGEEVNVVIVETEACAIWCLAMEGVRCLILRYC